MFKVSGVVQLILIDIRGPLAYETINASVYPTKIAPMLCKGLCSPEGIEVYTI